MSLDVGHLHEVSDRSFGSVLLGFQDADKAAWITDTAQRLARGVAGDEHVVRNIHQRMRSTIG
jgi:hypothetical protein